MSLSTTADRIDPARSNFGYMIMAGIPAQSMRPRFDPGIANRLMALSWSDWTHDRLRTALMDFRALKAEAFLEKYQG